MPMTLESSLIPLSVPLPPALSEGLEEALLWGTRDDLEAVVQRFGPGGLPEDITYGLEALGALRAHYAAEGATLSAEDRRRAQEWDAAWALELAHALRVDSRESTPPREGLRSA